MKRQPKCIGFVPIKGKRLTRKQWDMIVEEIFAMAARWEQRVAILSGSKYINAALRKLEDATPLLAGRKYVRIPVDSKKVKRRYRRFEPLPVTLNPKGRTA